MGYESLGSLRQKVNDQLKNDETTGFWTKAQLNRYVVMGLRDLSRQAYCVESSAREEVKPGVQAYELPLNLIHGGIYNVEFEPPDESPRERYPLKYKPIRLLRSWGTTAGDPLYFSLWKNCLYLYPVPERSGAQKINLVEEDGTVWLELPNEENVALWTVDGGEIGRTELALEVVSGFLTVELTNGDVFYLGAVTGTGTAQLYLKDEKVYAELPNGDKLYLWESEDAYGYGRILVQYYGLGEEPVDDADGIEIEDAAVDALVDYVCWRAYLQDENVTMAMVHRQNYNEFVVDANQRYRQRQMVMGNETHRFDDYGWGALH